MLLQTQKFQYERVLDEVGGFFHDLPLDCQATDLVLVPAKCKSLVETAGNLSLQFSHAPMSGSGLDLVETSLGGIVQREQLDVVGPAQCEAAGKIAHHFPTGLVWPLAFGQIPRRRLGFLGFSRK